MQIHVARNGQKFGPYSTEEVRAQLATGQISLTDLAWHEGLAQWTSLGTVMNTFPGIATAPPLIPVSLPKTKSGLAKASFIIGIVTSILWMMIFGYLATLMGKPRDEQIDPVKAVAGLTLLLNIVGSLVGFILGCVVVGKPISNRWMAITGIVLNGVAPIVIFFIVVVAVAATRHHSQFQYQY